jgi:hypothetical protein
MDGDAWMLQAGNRIHIICAMPSSGPIRTPGQARQVPQTWHHNKRIQDVVEDNGLSKRGQDSTVADWLVATGQERTAGGRGGRDSRE